MHGTRRGDICGERHGPIGFPLPEFRAREGFAVSGILIEAAHSIEGLGVSFSRIVGDGLDVEDSHASDQYLLILDNATLLSTGGTPAVGLWGWWARDELRGMGMFRMP